MANRNSHEQRFCTELKKWLHHNFPHTCFIEAKIATGTSPLNYKNNIKDHQTMSLLMIQNGSFSYKISDMDRLQKPFDLFHAYKDRAYYAIIWIRRGNKTFYLIEPSAIQSRIDRGDKSLTEEDAKQIAYLIGELK